MALSPFDPAAMTLLGSLQFWRLRAIEHVELSRALWSERERTIHVHSFRDLMGRSGAQFADFRNEIALLIDEQAKDAASPGGRRGGDVVELVLPITELPKLPVLELAITVDGNPVYRVSKDESARIQALYLVDLGKKAGIIDPEEELPRFFIDFLTFIFYFPAHGYERQWSHLKRRWPFTEPDHAWVRRSYLSAEGGKNGLPSGDEMYARFKEWSGESEDFLKFAKSYVQPDPMSGSQYPMLSVPYLFQELGERAKQEGDDSIRPRLDEVLPHLIRLRELLRDARSRSKESEFAGRLIGDYYSYGYRWMSFARCVIPLDRPFIVKVREKRVVYFTRYRHKPPSVMDNVRPAVWQGLSFADAETNHVNIELADTAVRIKHKPVVYGEEIRRPLDEWDGGREPHLPDEEKSTFELYTRADSKRERPDRIFIKCPLRLTRVQSGLSWLLIAITAFAWLLLGLRGFPELQNELIHWPGTKAPVTDNGLTAKDATLILVPVAFAVTLLLSKQDSTLGSWMRKVRYAILLVELFGVLATTFFLVLFHHIKIG